MESTYQMQIEDLEFTEQAEQLPARMAFVDECGNYGFDFTKKNTSRFYILTAVVVETAQMPVLQAAVESIKIDNGFGGTELKSGKIGDKKRNQMMSQLMPLSFRLALFVADKQRFTEDSPLANYADVFVKNMSDRLYQMLYGAYPKLQIRMDRTGWPAFQASFREYVARRRGQINLFNEYDFDFTEQRDEQLIQLADFIGSSLHKYFLKPDNYPNYLEMLHGKIVAYEEFPGRYAPYWGRAKPEDYQYDERIYAMAVRNARNFIQKHEGEKGDDRKAQIAVLRYLLFYVTSISSTKYVSSNELVEVLREATGKKMGKNTLFRRMIAPMRDEGVILSSCNQGYKIPISVADIVVYLNQTTTTVGPMLHRMGIAREHILQSTDKHLDIFNDPAFLRYKRYFGDVD